MNNKKWEEFKNKNNVLSINDLSKKLKVSHNKVIKLIKLHNLSWITYNNAKFFNFNDYEYLKSLTTELHSKVLTTELKDLITLPKLCLRFNVPYDYIKKLKNLNLKPKKYKNINYYTKESFDILENYLKENPYHSKNNKLTKNEFSKYLKISREKLDNYLQYFKPNSEEFDGKYYTYEFADKMAEFIKSHPSIRQNKVYVRELNNMEFDSRAEAYYYCYMKDHNHEIKHHPLNLYYFDSKGQKRRYEVDFLVDGKLVEIKGNIQFDKDGKPFFCGKSWQEKYDCMIENNVEMILSSEFDENGQYKYMRYYFHEKYSFVKYIKELTEELNKDDIKYMSKMKQSLAKNCNIYKCVETSEVHFSFEWESNHIFVRGNAIKSAIYGKHYVPLSSSERREYILSKVEELRAKGLDVSWFEENEEKYFPKIIDEKQKDITIFDM